jgi:aspartate carbamoyltransferase regulatory subunit
MEKQQHIGYIANGINLDHIPHGRAFYIMQVLDLAQTDKQVGIGLNLPSKKLGYKDLIKVEDYYLNKQQLEAISLFAPCATLCTIKNFEVIEKIELKLPEKIENLIICPNSRCVSKLHKSKFIIFTDRQNKTCVKCHYCEQEFLLDTIKEYKI